MKAPIDSVHTLANFLARHSAIIALALFAVVGVAVLDDYGVAIDEGTQRSNGIASFDYILGDADALPNGVDRFYGVAFELPLIAVERILRLDDSRSILLSRHIITHAFFLAGGFFAWLLAYRLFGSRLIALFAMLIFLLHPRLYAHSFFNTKDLPFLSMFMIALYLTHRAFRRDSVWAFALCGVGVGLLVNIRIMGVMLIPAVLGMLALDAFYAMKRGNGRLKHVLTNVCVFSAMSVATLYAALPSTWRDPLGIAEAAGLLAEHPHRGATLFRGEIVQHPNIPWDYIPTWILITTPPVALILAALGIGYVARVCAADWRGALANSTARFGLLAAACLILPIVAVIALNSNTFNGWRHVYFLYAPICVLAAFGLRGLAEIPKPRLRAVAFALAAVGIAAIAVRMVSLHPLQSEYFNFLVNKSGLAERWDMDYWRVSYREALETLLKTRAGERVAIAATHRGEQWMVEYNMEIIPPDERRRLHVNPNFPSFRVISGDGGEDAVWTREIYGVPIVSIADARAETEAAFQDAYAAARASAPSASGGGFDVYADGGALTYINEDCGEEDARGRFSLFAFPVDQNDLPLPMRNAGLEYERLDFDFQNYGARMGGKCVIVRDLPDYAISHIETSRFAPGESRLWSVVIPLAGYRERYERALSRLSGEPAARSGFDIWLDGNELTYVKENCDEADTRGRFFLSIFPADLDDLPQSARDAGREHESLNFDFARYGAILDGKCVIIRRLPDYAISRVETGQWLPGEGELWRAGVEDLTQWREGAGGAKGCWGLVVGGWWLAVSDRPVIPAKAGIQTVSAKLATRNQVQIAVSGSPLPLWAYRGRFAPGSAGVSPAEPR